MKSFATIALSLVLVCSARADHNGGGWDLRRAAHELSRTARQFAVMSAQTSHGSLTGIVLINRASSFARKAEDLHHMVHHGAPPEALLSTLQGLESVGTHINVTMLFGQTFQPLRYQWQMTYGQLEYVRRLIRRGGRDDRRAGNFDRLHGGW
jgi:hypothetical protein